MISHGRLTMGLPYLFIRFAADHTRTIRAGSSHRDLSAPAEHEGGCEKEEDGAVEVEKKGEKIVEDHSVVL